MEARALFFALGTLTALAAGCARDEEVQSGRRYNGTYLTGSNPPCLKNRCYPKPAGSCSGCLKNAVTLID